MSMRNLLMLATIAVLCAVSSATAAETFRECSNCPLMVKIPGGSFDMGLTTEYVDWVVQNGAPREKTEGVTPQHRVAVSPFSISETEVTIAQFTAFERETKREPTNEKCLRKIAHNAERLFGLDELEGRGDGAPSLPISCVSFDDALAYVRWLSEKTGKDYRLPSEAEWEYAARARSGEPRFWGWANPDACKRASVADKRFNAEFATPGGYFPCTDGFPFEAPVRRFAPNPFGIYDMIGNVWEWTSDCYNPSYVGAPSDGTPWQSGDCTKRVLRGGSWETNPWKVGPAWRAGVNTSARLRTIGFRAARSD